MTIHGNELQMIIALVGLDEIQNTNGLPVHKVHAGKKRGGILQCGKRYRNLLTL